MKSENPKSEIRNQKQIRIFKISMFQMFERLEFVIWNLFRVSIFEFRISIFLPLAFCFLLLFSCGGKKDMEASVQRVNIVKAERSAISETVLLTGSIEAEDFAEIYPRAPGKVIKKLLNEGDPVKKDQAIMLTLQDEVGYTFKPSPVISKINGFVGRIYVDAGATVNPNQPAATVVNPEKMRVKVEIPEIYLPAVKIGAKINFGEFSGEVASISKAIEIGSRTSHVEIKVPNSDHKLVHGMFTKLNMPMVTHENAIVVPAGVVSWEADKQFVFKVADGKVFKSEVKIGIRNNSSVEILDGVAEGDVLVNGNLIELLDGEPVVVE